MSELIVACFGEPYRAQQVIHEMRRVCPSFASDLDNAAALLWSDDGSIRVQQLIDPTDAGGAAWSSLWAAFISWVILLPHAGPMQVAASVLTTPGSSTTLPDGDDHAYISPTWWITEFQLPEEFLRDACALVQPGESAIMMVSTAPKPLTLVRQLRQQGGTVIHFALTSEQSGKLHAALALQ